MWIALLLRDDCDALQRDTLNGRALLAAAAGFGWDIGDALQHIITGCQLAEGRVLTIEELGFAVAEEKLGAGAVRVLRSSHGDDATDMGFLVELSFHFPTGAAGARHPSFAGLGVRATPLDHKTLDDTVEGRAVIEAGAGELLEVFYSFWRDVGPEGDGDFAVAGLEYGDFVGGGGVFAHKNGKKPRQGPFGKNQKRSKKI